MRGRRITGVDLLTGGVELRRQLQAMTTLSYDAQPAAVASIGLPHSIRLEARRSDTPAGSCFAYAFQILQALHDDPVLLALADRDPLMAFGVDIHPDSCFVRWLWINEYFISGYGGDVVLYFAHERPVHAARTVNGHLLSKWGTGHLWRHDLNEVPESYGTHFVRVKPNTRLSTIDLYRQFIQRVFPTAWEGQQGEV
jgi:hypothetical protein